MRTTISETDGFRTIMEVTNITNPADHVQIRFLTEWDRARRDGSEQVQYSVTLSLAQLKNLKDLL
jgi:hypothetical protein